MGELELVILKDEDGNKVRFTQILTFEFGESLYVAITPEKEIDGIKNGDVILLEIREDEDGTDCYLPLENEQKLKRVWEEFEKLYHEQ